METLFGILNTTYESMSTSISESAPTLLATSVVIILGVLAARAAKAITHKVLELCIQFEHYAQRVGLSDALERGDVKQNTSDILGTLVYWLGLVFTASVALSMLGFTTQAMVAEFTAMIPNVVLSVAILIFGLNLCSFLATLIQATAVNAEVRQGRLVRNVSYYGMGALVVVFALQTLGINSELLSQGMLILFGSACAGTALAFGLGSKELAGRIAKSRYKTEQAQSETLAEASELGNQVLPIRRKAS